MTQPRARSQARWRAHRLLFQPADGRPGKVGEGQKLNLPVEGVTARQGCATCRPDTGATALVATALVSNQCLPAVNDSTLSPVLLDLIARWCRHSAVWRSHATICHVRPHHTPPLTARSFRAHAYMNDACERPYTGSKNSCTKGFSLREFSFPVLYFSNTAWRW